MAWAPTAIMGVPTVVQVRSWAGLDVHAAKVVAVTVDAVTGELSAHRLSGETSKVVEFCAGLPAPARVAYEAGPTGFTLARALRDVPAWGAWSRRRARSSGPRPTGSRPTVETPSDSCGC